MTHYGRMHTFFYLSPAFFSFLLDEQSASSHATSPNGFTNNYDMAVKKTLSDRMFVPDSISLNESTRMCFRVSWMLSSIVIPEHDWGVTHRHFYFWLSYCIFSYLLFKCPGVLHHLLALGFCMSFSGLQVCHSSKQTHQDTHKHDVVTTSKLDGLKLAWQASFKIYKKALCNTRPYSVPITIILEYIHVEKNLFWIKICKMTHQA